jgi:hypothetical protein
MRPYRRITQLGGKDSSKTITSIGGWHRLFFRERTQAQEQEQATGGGAKPSTVVVQTQLRPEARDEDTAVALPAKRQEGAPARQPTPSRPPVHTPQWTQPDDTDAPSYAIYRPTPREAPAQARRPESQTVRR